MGFYDEMQGIASDLLAEFGQGKIEYGIQLSGSGPNYNPANPTPDWHSIDAVASGVSAYFISNGLAEAGDLAVTAAILPGVTYALTGQLRIDGVVYRIISISDVPAAGVNVVCKFVVRKN